MKLVICAAALTLCMAAVHAYMPKGQVIEYRKEIVPGDTVWSVCAEIATDDENLQYLVWKTMKENGIEKADQLQPGRLLVVRVPEKEVRG